VIKRLVRSSSDWRMMQGVVVGGESLTKALEAEHRAEIVRDDDRSEGR